MILLSNFFCFFFLYDKDTLEGTHACSTINEDCEDDAEMIDIIDMVMLRNLLFTYYIYKYDIIDFFNKFLLVGFML